MRASRAIAFTAAVASTAASSAARAESFVVIRDDGSLTNTNATPYTLRKEILARYAETGLPMPEVISVWTTFPMMGNDFATYIDPRGNDVKGIGIPVTTFHEAPLRAILYHNNVLEIPKRAAKSRAPVEGFASYLFLLEFGHQWGPAVSVPDPNGGELEGFPYHWSFFLEGTSPEGGNQWTDNGDGTFTVVPRAPKDVQYTPLDLYLMGLAPPEEVQPFGVLTDAVVPPTPTDPLWGGSFSGQSFPWFDTTNPPMTIQATRRMLTIDDVVGTNGARDPAAVASKTFTVSIVLAVPQDATDQDIADASATFEPIAADFAPAFHRATSERGTLDVLTETVPGAGGAGGSGGASSASTTTGAGGHPGVEPSGGDCGCRTVGDDHRGDASGGALALLVAAAAIGRTRGRRARPRP